MAIEVQNTPLQDPNAYIGSVAGGVTRTGSSIANANVAGNVTGVAGQANFLQTGGAAAMDPQLRTQADALYKDVAKVTKPWTTKVTTAERTITTAQADRDRLQAKIDAGETLSRPDQSKFDRAAELITKNQAIIDEFRPKIDAQNGRITTFMEQNVATAPQLTDLLSESFPELNQQLVNSQPFLDQMGKLGQDGQALVNKLRQGFQGSDITFNNAEAVDSVGAQLGAAPTFTAAQANYVPGPQAALGQAAQAAFVQGPQAAQASLSGTPIRDVTTSAIQAGQVGPQQQIAAQQVQAAQMGPIAAVRGPAGYTPQQVQAIQAQRVADISAQQIQSGALGNQLMGEAQRRVSLNGQLSPEATRDAIQSARQGFAARGMATGNAALGAELLNRDRYSRQRGLEDLQFAQGVQGADITRQQANQDAALRAAAANQSAAAGFSLADQSAGMNAQQLNQSAGARAAEFLQSGQLQAGLANAQSAYNTEQTNAQLRQQGALSNQDADLRAQAANQGTTLSAGTTQAQLGTQAAIAGAGNNLTAGQSNQSADLNVFGQGNNMSQFNAGQTNQLGLAGYQGSINQNQYDATNRQQTNTQNTANQQQANLETARNDINQGQFGANSTNTAGLATLGVASQYGLAQGQMAQQNSQFNAGSQTQNNQFNSTGNFNQSVQQSGNNRANWQTDTSALSTAYGIEGNVIGQGLEGAAIRAGLAGAANPNAMMMNMYNSQLPVGSQAVGPVAQGVGQIYTNNANIGMSNTAGQNWAAGTNYVMNNMPSTNTSLTGSPLGDFALNTGVNLATNAASAAIAKSDRRLKENVRPAGRAGDILGLKAYKFDYKDGGKDVVGFMAQDVQKVIPEAVTEFWDKGNKRLAIKPAVLGRALAQELMKQAQAA